MDQLLKQGRARWFLLILIFLLALGLRLYRIGHQSLWMDEIFTLRISPLAWPEMSTMNQMHDNGKPPLYYVLMHEWLRYGSSDAWVRLPSAICGALTCVVACFLGSCFFGERGWLLGLLLSVSPLQIWYSQETRMYALLGLLGALAFYFHTQFCRRDKPFDLVWFTIFGVLTCYSFPYGFFFLPVTALYALLHRPSLSLKKLQADAVVHILIFAVFALWISRLVHAAVATFQDYKGQHLQVLAYTLLSLFAGTSIGMPPDDLRLYGSHALAMHPVGALVMAGTLVISLAVFFLGLRRLARGNWNAFVFSVCGAGVLIGGPFLVALVKSTVTNNPRYAFLSLFPLFLAVAAFYWDAWDRPAWSKRILGALFAALLALSLFNYYDVPGYARDDIRSATAYLTANPAKPVDFIFVCDPADANTVRHYYHGQATIQPWNFPSFTTAPEELAGIKAMVAGHRRPALVYLRPDHGDPRRELPSLFQSLFPVVGQKSWPGVTCYIYEVPAPAAAHP